MKIPSTAAALAGLALAASAQTVLSDDLATTAIDDVAITPDGRLAVAREHTGIQTPTAARFYDLATGALVRTEALPGTFGSGVSQDAVLCTMDRAAVMGTALGIFDLSDPALPLLALHDVGVWPRDLAATPQGDLLVVRGGSPTQAGGGTGQQFVFDLQTGAELAQAPGAPRQWTGLAFDVDSVVASDRYGVVLSEVGLPFAPAGTRVTVWDLRPAAGPPVVAFETHAGSDLPGEPHDVTLAPDGSFAAVRSEVAVALVDLSPGAPGLAWTQRLFGDPDPAGGILMDSIEVSADHVATLSPWSGGAQLDLFTVGGKRRWDRRGGVPHDLAISPDGRRLVVRTSAEVALYDLFAAPSGSGVRPVATAQQPSTDDGFVAGLDSVAVTDTRAVTLARTGASSDVRVWNLRSGNLLEIGSWTMPDRPVDVAASPDGRCAVVSGLTHVGVLGLRSGALLLDHDPVGSPGGDWWPWCDGVAVSDDRAVAFGYQTTGFPAIDGWVSVIDLAPAP